MTTLRRQNGKITREYSAWKAMKARCYSPSNKKLTGYQNKGIIVCDRWLHSFENFLEDMGKCPENFSLDRIDNDKTYCPENCRWTDDSTQTKNRGNFNLVYTYNGKTQVLKDWAKEFNIKYITLYLRITRSKLSFEEAISEDPFKNLIEYQSKKQTLKEWSKELNIDYQVLVDRKYRGWTIEKMFTEPKKSKLTNT
jgi:hypothetical protein